MKTLIVDVEQNEASYGVCRNSATFAQKMNANVILIHVVDYNVWVNSFPHNPDKIKEALIKQIKSHLVELESIFALRGVDVKQTIIAKGCRCEVLKRYSEEYKAAVITGSENHSLLDCFVFTENEKLIHSSQSPIIVVGERPLSGINRILCPCDSSISADSLIKKTLKTAFVLNAHVDILHISRAGIHTASAVEEKIRRLTSSYKGSIKTHFMTGRVLEVIRSFIRLNAVDLISVGKTGGRRFSKFFSDRIAEHLIKKPNCPVITFKTPA